MKNMLAASLVGITLACVAPAKGADISKLDARIDAAHEVLHELMATPDKGIPFDIAAKAHCIAVIPGYKKGAFVVGAQYGQGLATCRTATGWSAPVFIQLTGASFGFQAGGQSTDLVLVGVNRRSLDDLLKDKVKLGGDIAAAELANAEFLTYSRSKGLFAGVDLTGDEVHQNTADTEAYYGKDIPYKTILSGAVPTPPSSHHFVATVNEMFRRGRNQTAQR
jgi:lipid-binding SYLF domain-containing protein